MDDDLLVSAGASALFHTAILAVVIFGLPGSVAPLESQPMIPVELVELKDIIDETPLEPEPEPVCLTTATPGATWPLPSPP